MSSRAAASRLPAGQTLGRSPIGISFEEARAFIANDGQRGPQRRILREGVYAINTAEFVVFTAERNYAVPLQDDKATLEQMRELIEGRDGFRAVVIPGESDIVGVVTVQDGPALEQEEIIAPTVGVDPDNDACFHNSFQDPEKFLAAGGRRGRQEQVLVEGTYYINRLFATRRGRGQDGDRDRPCRRRRLLHGTARRRRHRHDYKHGELVGKGQRGVWETALQPGKYAINPYALKVVSVPTTNFVLRWIEGRIEGHRYDENLAEIKLITKDAFEPILPLSIVLHIAYEDAPPRRPAIRRHQAPGRADARPDGLGLFQGYGPVAHAHRADLQPGRDPGGGGAAHERAVPANISST